MTSFRDYIGQGAPQQTAPQPTGGYGDFLMSSLPKMMKEIMAQRDRDTYQRSLARGNAPDSPLGYQPQDLSRTMQQGPTVGQGYEMQGAAQHPQSLMPNPGQMGQGFGQSIGQSMSGSGRPGSVNVNQSMGQSLGERVGTQNQNMTNGMGMMAQNVQRAMSQMQPPRPSQPNLAQNATIGNLAQSMPQPMSRGKGLAAPQQVPTGALAELMRRKLGR